MSLRNELLPDPNCQEQPYLPLHGEESILLDGRSRSLIYPSDVNKIPPSLSSVPMFDGKQELVQDNLQETKTLNVFPKENMSIGLPARPTESIIQFTNFAHLCRKDTNVRLSEPLPTGESNMRSESAVEHVQTRKVSGFMKMMKRSFKRPRFQIRP